MLGAGMVVLQPETRRMVVVHDPRSGRWFLPKGRKDVGESLEQAALREAYEEVRSPPHALGYGGEGADRWVVVCGLDHVDGVPRRDVALLSSTQPACGD
jgi:8-oxo-dGTP pyrophosphatase MutT (NUDIX family)